jgi:hypothetical protein
MPIVQVQTQPSYNDLFNAVKQFSVVEFNQFVSQIIEWQMNKPPTFDLNDEVIESAINGTLELLIINKKNNLFNLYPVVGAQNILCDFPKTLLQKAIAAIGHYANVVGQYHYKYEHPYPYYVKVTDIEIYPDENQLPNLFDLRGIAPNATNGLSSEDFVREMRDEW